MIQVKHKNKFWIFTLAFVVLAVCVFSLYNVFAKDDGSDDPWTPTEKNDADAEKKCSEVLGESGIERYNATMKPLGDNKYQISVNPDSSLNSDTKKALRKVVFNLISVNGKDVSSQGKTVSYNNPLTITASTYTNSYGDDVVNAVIEMSTSSKDPMCSGTFTITVEVEVGLKLDDEVVGSDITVPDNIDTGGNTTAIDCSNPTNDTETAICLAKSKAENSIGITDITEPFKCDPTQFYKDTELEGENYYTNKNYLYNSETTKVNGTYVFHHRAGDSADTVNFSCEVTCEEGVVVEYGPPVASKAGLCFEYKVRVTSNVRCYMSKTPPPPDNNDYKVCTPYPTCTNRARTYFYNQGGPNEEFDSCVQKCDGGKYTSKCSKKCYKKVYGNSSSKTSNTLALSYSSKKLSGTSTYSKSDCVAKNVAYNQNYNGCYTWDGDSIVWNYYTPGIWYYRSGWFGKKTNSGSDPSQYAVTKADGIERHIFSNGPCQDTCWWSGCSKDQYMNYGIAEEDKQDNVDEYQRVANECSAKASCSTRTAEFTISVDYTDGNNTKKTIDFPYESKKDTLDTNEDKSKVSNTLNKDTTILGYAGCYDSTNNITNYYQTVWSFPGSWINLKTGEVTYKDVSSESSWRTMEDKFCIPLDAQNVNVNWWNTYYSLNIDKPTSSTYSEENNVCSTSSANGSVYKAYDKDSYTYDDVVYNITAHTENFGYFGWNITTKCFYALNSNPSESEETSSSSSTKAECRVDDDSTKVRPVDLTDVFPSTDGSDSGSTTDYTSTGRTPGFNWSTYATISSSSKGITTSSTSNMTSNPTAYLAEVQSLGYTIYNGDDYLDYRFELTPSELKALKEKVNSGDTKNYTAYDGDVEIGSSGVSRYTSKLFRSGGTISSSKIPSTSVLDCNNIENYKATQCQTFEN